MDDVDLIHLRRCIELAAEAVDNGDEPFGSLLVDQSGNVVAERRNEVNTAGDCTAHPELALAAWASQNLGRDECVGATMYTSGEHCTMCAAAHVWAGIGRLVYVLAAPTIAKLAPSGPSIALRAADVVAASNVAVSVEGPCHELTSDASRLFQSP